MTNNETPTTITTQVPEWTKFNAADCSCDWSSQEVDPQCKIHSVKG